MWSETMEFVGLIPFDMKVEKEVNWMAVEEVDQNEQLLCDCCGLPG